MKNFHDDKPDYISELQNNKDRDRMYSNFDTEQKEFFHLNMGGDALTS